MVELNYVGKKIARVDAVEKALGSTVYGRDLRLRNMLVGKVLRSPHPHAKIAGIEVSGAKTVPGVEAVLTARDIANNNQYNHGGDAEILASKRVRFIGDEVALVAAINEASANAALDAIEVEYEPLSCVQDLNKAISPESVRLHEDKPNNIAYTFDVTRGNVAEGFQKAAMVVSDAFFFPTLHQSYLEPICAVAVRARGKLTVYSSSQTYFLLRSEIAKVLGLDENEIVIKAMEAGGAFGARNEQKTPILAAALALHTDKPVRIVNSSEEELLAARPSMAMRIEVSLAADRKGRFLGKKTKILANNGAYSSHGLAVLSIAALRADTLYRYGATHVLANGIYTNSTPVSAYRGFGNPQAHFAVESIIDELALKLGLDPTIIRMKNFIRPGDTSIHGYKIASCGLKEAMQQAVKLSDWNTKKKHKQNRRGIGVAALVHATGSRAGSPLFSGGSAMIRVDISGKISVYVGEAEIGQGSKTVFAQIAAEELNCPPQDIDIVLGDTDQTPYSWGTHGSKLTHVLGNAVLLAARSIKGQLLDVAGKIYTKDNLTLRDGWLWDQDNVKIVSFRDLAAKGCAQRSGQPFVGTGQYEPDCPMPDDTGYGNPAPAYPFGVQMAEVTVHPTGKVQVDRIISVHDVGKAINPMMVEGQVEGGVVQGLGMAIMENLCSNNEGVVQTNSFLEYKIPTIYESPQIEVGIVETIDPLGPYGAKGVGEPPIIAVAPAIANAVYDAVGVRVKRIPITPGYLKGLLKAEAKSKEERPS